jgi:hypothetical protein
MSSNYPTDCITLYDSGRVPLLIRIPCLALGLLCLSALADLLSRHVFGVGVGFLSTRPGPFGLIPALLGTGILSYGMLSIWFGRNRICWIPASRELVSEGMNLWWRSRTRIPRDVISSIAVEKGSVKSSFWDLYAVKSDGTRVWLTRQNVESEAMTVARNIAGGVGVDVTTF